ncbi:MAG: GGDEF domain-containing protein [Myxococcota bacterium]
MSYKIEDERTQAESIAPTFEKPVEDVSFLVLRGPDAGRRFVVRPPGGYIGREESAVVPIGDPNVSRQHALIEFTPDARVMLSDMDSRNGVYVNGVQVARAQIFDGNNVQLSNDTVMRVRFQDPAETALLEQLQGTTTTDRLTTLPNRRYAQERLLQEVSFAARHGAAVSVALIDVDDFQKVVDVDGQGGADRLMVEIANVVRGATRLEDVVARYGTDELIVILRGAAEAPARAYADRVREAIRNRTYETGDIPIRATATVGVATFAVAATPAAGAGRGRTKKSKTAAVVGGALPAAKKTPVAAAAPALGRERHPKALSDLLARAEQAVFAGKTSGKDRVAVAAT